MTTLLLAVLSASLLGSLHCAGMCGPFALYAATKDGLVRATRLTAYHFGRLATYLAIGAIVGLAGRAVDTSGQAIGISATAARVAGVMLVILAILKVVPRPKTRSTKPNPISTFVAHTRPTIARLPNSLRPAGVGAVTVLLPCGWLYAFAIVAAGAGGVPQAIAVMIAFWLGTLPWLSGLTLAAKPLSTRPKAVNAITAVLLASAGIYTMTGRAEADFAPLLETARTEAGSAQIKAVTDVTPPCCVARSKTEESP